MKTLIKNTLVKFNLESNNNVVSLYDQELDNILDLEYEYGLMDSKQNGFNIEVLELLLDVHFDNQM